MKYPLYDYQAKVFNQLLEKFEKGIKRVLCQLPTRAGKSLIATAIIEENLKHKKITWFLCHTNVLINQMSEELTTHGIRHGIITPRHNTINYRTQIISKDTLSNRYKKLKARGFRDPDTIIVDETHLAISKIYFELLKLFPNSQIVGLTATPIRLDGKGLDSLYDDMIIGPSIKELQEKKRLCKIETYQTKFDAAGMHSRGGDFAIDEVLERVDKPRVLKNIVKHWEQLAKGKKTLTFCASISHAQHMADEFNNAGYPSVAVSSEDPAEVIAQKVRDYYKGKYINLVSVQLFIMGFTVKDCECIIQTRPTQSLMIYMQTVGRGMVWLEGKTLINLDCVNNVERHGLPEADRQWSLIGKPQAEKEDKTELKRCIACLQPTPKKERYCEACGFDFAELKIDTGRSLTPEEKDGKLVKVS